MQICVFLAAKPIEIYIDSDVAGGLNVAMKMLKLQRRPPIYWPKQASHRHHMQFGVPVALVTVCVEIAGMRVRWSSACHVVAKMLKCSKNVFQGITTWSRSA